MGQLEDFRASLKRKDSAESSEGEIPVKSIAKAKQEKMKRRTLGVSGELHLELKALSVWRTSSGVEGAQCLEDQKSSEGKSWDYRHDSGDDEGVLQEVSGGEEVRREVL